MTKIGALALALVAILSFPLAGRADEAAKVDEWVKGLSAQDESVRLNAALALGKLGKNAVGPVAAALADPDADTRYYAVWALGLLGTDAQDRSKDVIKLLGDKNEQVRRKAVFALGRVAPSAAETIPLLIKALGDDNIDVRADAAQAFGRLGKPALPALAEALKSDNVNLRLKAVAAIGQIDGPEAVNTLVEALKARPLDVRREAVRVLGGLRIPDESVVLALAGVLKSDADETARLDALLALQQLGAAARPAAPVLAAALGDQRLQTRETAFALLNTVGVDPVRAMQEHLQEADVERRIEVAAWMLHQVDPNHREAVAILTAALKEIAPAHRHQAALSLARVGQTPADTVEALTEALKGENTSYRADAATALGSIGRPAAKANPELIKALKDAEVAVRRQAAWALSETGDDAKTILPALAEALRDDDAYVRNQATYAMIRFKHAALPHLKTAIVDKDRDVRRTAINLLAELTDDPKEPLAVLADALRDGDPKVRRHLLGRIPRFKAAAVPMLIEVLKGGPVEARLMAAQTLGAIGPDARDALDALKEAAKGTDATLKTLAEAAIKSIEKQ